MKTEVRPLIDATFLSLVDCLYGVEGGVVVHVRDVMEVFLCAGVDAA